VFFLDHQNPFYLFSSYSIITLILKILLKFRDLRLGICAFIRVPDPISDILLPLNYSTSRFSKLFYSNDANSRSTTRSSLIYFNITQDKCRYAWEVDSYDMLATRIAKFIITKVNKSNIS